MSIRVVGICGSLRRDSVTSTAVQIALRGAEEAGSVTDFLDLADLPLPFCDGRDDADSYDDSVQQLRRFIRNSQGVILGTPEYHNSMTGALKNTIDLCTREDFEHKMVGVIGVAGGMMGAINSINHLRTVMRGVGAWVVPHQVSLSNSDELSPEKIGENLAIEHRLQKLGGDVTKFARLIAAGILDVDQTQEW